MAEYIEKTSVIQARPETLNEEVESENGDEKDTLRKQSYNKGWNRCKKTYIEDIEQIPPADVIEREKIDKAIEEIQNANVCECHCITCIRTEDVLEILRRI